MLMLFLLAGQIDLNRTSLAEIYELPVDSIVAKRIYEYRELYGKFRSVYELRNIPEIDAETFEKIKPLVKIAVPFPPRTEWGSILDEQKKLANEEPPSKGAIDEWEDLLFSPMNINNTNFDDLLMIDRMTPIDASSVMRHLQQREIKSSRDLQRVQGLSHYAYVSLRRYVQYEKELDKKPHGGLRIKLENENRLDIGEDENLATRLSYLTQAIEDFNNTSTDLKNYYDWTDEQCEILKNNLTEELDTLQKITPEPKLSGRLRMNYQKRLKIGVLYNKDYNQFKGYVGLANIGPLKRFYLGNYRVVWAEGLMIDNTDEYRARMSSRSTGIFGDLTENYQYKFSGAAGSFLFSIPTASVSLKPSFFYSATMRDAIVNPDGSIWRIYSGSMRYPWLKNKLTEQTTGINIGILPFEELNPGTRLALEAMSISYDKKFDPVKKWIDIPYDKYDPEFYSEITALSKDSSRLFYGAEFLVPIQNTFVSGEFVKQRDTINSAYAYLIKSRIQYEFLFLNILFRHYDIGYDNPFNRGFSEYRRFEDTPFEKPYALLNPEYISIYDDPAPKPEEGVFLETRYQLTRNIILTRAYLDLFRNLSHNLFNQRAYFELEFQPVFPVRLRYSQKFIRKYLPKPIMPTLSKTSESSVRVFFFLSNFDALRIECRYGNVDLMASEAQDQTLTGGFLSFSFEHNFIKGFSVEGGIALWSTDGMSQWIFEDVGIDFLSGYGMKYYIVTSQKIGNVLMRLKFRQKLTNIEHYGLYNNPEIYYPDLPGARVEDFINNENSVKINLQMDYIF